MPGRSRTGRYNARVPTVHALADLHLSLDGSKPMDVFGEAWRDHPSRMARAWDASVAPDDVVLLPGDLSWATSLERAGADLRWIGERTGRKVLLRGNHDTWWTSASKVRRALPGGCSILQHDAVDLGGLVVVGARGWTAPDDPTAKPEDEAIFRREIERLKLSVADADRRFPRGTPRLAMVHYPPWIVGRAPTEVVGVLRDAGVTCCVYGHLHGTDHALGVQGTHDGIRFVLVAADAVDFAPVALTEFGGSLGRLPE